MGRRKKSALEQLNTSAATKLDPLLFKQVQEICEIRRWTISTFMREAAAELVKSFKKEKAA